MNRPHTLRLATVFSGIGAIEQALLKLKVPHEIVFACDNGEREISESYDQIVSYCHDNSIKDINSYVKSLYSRKGSNWMKASYFANYKISEDNWYEDIRFIDGTKYEGKVDLFVGGSPCQSFSAIGKRGGLEDARGTLFYEYARLVKQIKPEVFIYENVPGMLNHDGGRTWKIIKEIFYSLGYEVQPPTILNAKDFGMPQDRKRLFVIGFKTPRPEFRFPQPVKLTTSLFNYLESKVDVRHYLGQKGFEFVTNPKYHNRARTHGQFLQKDTLDVINTQKANQQFNWNGDFIFEELEKVKGNPAIMERAYVSEWKGKKGVIRQMSHRECLRLMGFDDSFKIVVPNVWAYRQAGNSIVVNVLEAIVRSILEVL